MKPVETMTAAEMQHEWNKMFRTDWATPTEDSWCVPEMRELLIRARPWVLLDRKLKRQVPPWAGLRFFARYGKSRVIVLRRWPHHFYITWALWWRKGRFEVEHWKGTPPLLPEHILALEEWDGTTFIRTRPEASEALS